MKDEIQKAIKTKLYADTALATALGANTQILYGWPTGKPLFNTTTKKVLLAWGADIVGSGKSRAKGGSAVTDDVPDSTVSFHLFAIRPEYINSAADALDTLWDETTLTTTNYRILRIVKASDVSMFDPVWDGFHRVLGFRFGDVWAK